MGLHQSHIFKAAVKMYLGIPSKNKKVLSSAQRINQLTWMLGIHIAKQPVTDNNSTYTITKIQNT